MADERKWTRRKIYGTLLKKYKITFINLALTYLIAFISLLFPLFFKLLIDIAFYEHDFAIFFRIIAGLSILLLCKFTVDLIMDLSFNYMFYRFNTDISGMVYNKILRLKPSNIIKSTVGEFINKINTETIQFWFVFLFLEIYLIMPVINIITSTVFISLVSFKTFLVIMIGLPVNILVSYRFSNRIKNIQENYVKNSTLFVGWIYNLLNGAREIILFSAQSFMSRRMSKRDKELIREKVKISLNEFAANSAVDGIYLLLILAIYIIDINDIIAGKLSLGSFISITMYIVIIREQSALLTEFAFNMRKSNVYINRVLDFLNQEEEPLGGGLTFPEDISSIEFKNVTFCYEDGNPVLKNLSLKINKGERIAIAGKSGIGKSTLLNLLLRFYDADEGIILINGIDIREFSLDSLREGIGVIFQEPYLLENTLRYNIERDEFRDSDEKLFRLLKSVHMDEFVSRLPRGLDYTIGKDGNKFSLGQMQRIVFARALNKNPPIFMFDEATASLDAESEDIINKTINNIAGDHIIIFVSHRLSSIKNSDRVVMLNNGSILACAPFDELLGTCNEFKELMLN